MIESLDLQTLVTGGAGVGTGAVTAGWVIKALVTKTLKDNDRRHDDNEKSIDEALNLLNKMRDDLSRHERDIAIALERTQDTRNDLDRGFESMRRHIKELKDER